jgi:hypothetical protein
MTQLLGALFLIAMLMCFGNVLDVLIKAWRRRHGQ